MKARVKASRIPQQGHKRRFKKPRSSKMKENTTFVRPGQAATGTTGATGSGTGTSGTSSKGGGKGSSGK